METPWPHTGAQAHHWSHLRLPWFLLWGEGSAQGMLSTFSPSWSTQPALPPLWCLLFAGVWHSHTVGAGSGHLVVSCAPLCKAPGAGLLWRPFLRQTLRWVALMGRGRFLVWAPAQGLFELSRDQALPQLSVCCVTVTSRSFPCMDQPCCTLFSL